MLLSRHTRRHEFIAGLGGTAAWPLVARAQQGERMRRVGALMNREAGDPEGQAYLTAFQHALQQLGWMEGRNLRIDTRWGANDVDRDRKYAAELVALAPDILLTSGTLSTAALQHVTGSLPIVFVRVPDPVGAGFVETLARPGGNITGFMLFEYSFGGKWLEVLKEISPKVTQAGVLLNSINTGSIGQFGAIQGLAKSIRVEVNPISVRNAEVIERAIAAVARSTDGGLIVTPSAAASIHRDLIIGLAAKHKLPAVYASRSNVIDGGLISYGPDWLDPFRLAAGYVDRILKGEKPDDLPVQAPTKYELVINLKTAKALGLTMPPQILARADEVIE